MTRSGFAPAVSIVTGGASGIGLALARELAARGSAVVIADLDAVAAERAASGLGPKASARFTNPISGMFRELRLDAARIARAIDSPP